MVRSDDRVYLDHHACAPLLPEVAALLAVLVRENLGNPSSPHHEGRTAKRLLENARRQISSAWGCAASDVVFVSGGTEACELGVRSLASRSKRLVLSRAEHPAVIQGALAYQSSMPVVFQDPRLLGESTDYQAGDGVLLTWVNHELGHILPDGLITRLHDIGAHVFLDASQGFTKLEKRAEFLSCDYVALASTKIGGPAGAGALIGSRDVQPILHGGGQERGRRGGTPDVRAMAGFGLAAEQARIPVDDRWPHVLRLRDECAIACLDTGGVINQMDGFSQAPWVLSASFADVRGVELVAALDLEGVAVSSGAACSSGLDEPSPVLTACFPHEPWRAKGALRVTLGSETERQAVDRFMGALTKVRQRTS